MAATSHDFWLRALGAAVWKTLHMSVYVAYALLVAHVSLGALQAERSPVMPVLLLTGIAVVAGLHVRAAACERDADVDRTAEARDGFVDVGAVDDIPDGRARTVCLTGERVAVFKYGGRISAVSNVCRHQNGPIGEGKIVGGCIVCPWHGYEYKAEDGCAPPPFTEKLPTFAVKVVRGRVLVGRRRRCAGWTDGECGCAGRPGQARGALIERNGEKMLQLVPGEIETLDASAETKPSAPVRIRTLQVLGELVDSKCHLGVMKPGDGPLHRDCAVRCLLGAVPPMFSERGASTRLALVRAGWTPPFLRFPRARRAAAQCARHAAESGRAEISCGRPRRHRNRSLIALNFRFDPVDTSVTEREHERGFAAFAAPPSMEAWPRESRFQLPALCGRLGEP